MASMSAIPKTQSSLVHPPLAAAALSEDVTITTFSSLLPNQPLIYWLSCL